MGSTRKQAPGEAPTIDEILQSIARSLSLLVKLKVKETQADRKMNEIIMLLHSLGCRPVEIAEVLGKTSNDVNPVISRARKGGGRRTTPSQKEL